MKSIPVFFYVCLSFILIEYLKSSQYNNDTLYILWKKNLDQVENSHKGIKSEKSL